MELLRRLIEILDAEGDLVENGVTHRIVIEVSPLFHGVAQRLEQLMGILAPLPRRETAHRQANFLGKNGVAGFDRIRDGNHDFLFIPTLEFGHPLIIVSQVHGIVLKLLLVGSNGIGLFFLLRLDLPVEVLDLGFGFLNAGLFLGGVKGLLQIEEFRALVFQFGDLAVQPLLLFLTEFRLVLALQFQGLHGLVSGGAIFQLGILIELFLSAVNEMLGTVGQCHNGVSQLLVVEDDRPLADIAIGIEHTGKGLGEDRLTGTGFADDGYGLILVEVQRNTPDGRQRPTTDSEVDVQVLDGQ